MFTAPRLGLLVLAACVAGCSGKPATGALLVVVNLERGLISRCVKVTATDGTSSKETKPIAIAMKTSLQVAIYGDGLVQPVTVQALGYTDEACTILAMGETSETAAGNFTSPASTLTLTLRANAGGDGGMNDGGRDAGVDAGVDAGTDAGFDAGVDMDGDGYPLPADCDDTNPNVHPTAPELCNNGIDDDCDNLADCEQLTCDMYFCRAGGQCLGGVCVGRTELCNDRMDNDGDTLIDCLDPDCTVGTLCDDSNSCTLGDRCVADGGCEKTMDKVCNMPPADAQCHVLVGTCLPDAGASCSYATMPGNCSDGLLCTTGDTCASGLCTGTPKVCNTPTNSCFQDMGNCQPTDGGCFYAPRATGTGVCSDSRNCTINDTCDGDGGCAGTTVSCPTPSQCHTATTGCDLDGGCLFNARTGFACDAGTGAGTCDSAFACNATPASLFPFTTSNFTDAQLPAGSGALTVSCNATLNTGGTPTLTNGCGLVMPSNTVIVQGGESTLLLRMSGLSVASGFTLTIAGNRPVIFAVVGNVTVDGVIRARNGNGLTACGNGGTGTNAGSGSGLGGGGGGGFGSVGGAGGNSGGAGGGAAGAVNGTATLIPLRGGCNGGNGSAAGGAGGGAVQIAASGTISVNGRIAAPGIGGVGAAANQGDSGGGGGSGGAILLEAATVTLNSGTRLTVNGGSGGEGSGGNSGTNGLDGNETSTTATPNGGDNSGNGGDGGRGAAGTTSAGAGSPGAMNNDGGGGGGGGVGRIRINASTCSKSGTGQVISPAQTGATCP